MQNRQSNSLKSLRESVSSFCILSKGSVKEFSDFYLSPIVPTIEEAEEELNQLTEEKENFEKENGNKLFNALSYFGACFQTANTAGDWNATTQQINMEAAQSIQKEALQNINTINEYTYQIEQTSLYRKAYATEELLGSLSDEQIRLVDIVIQEEELRDATQLMNLSNRIMGVDPLYRKPYDGSAGWEARFNLVKQLREANPQKTDAEQQEKLLYLTTKYMVKYYGKAGKYYKTVQKESM